MTAGTENLPECSPHRVTEFRVLDHGTNKLALRVHELLAPWSVIVAKGIHFFLWQPAVIGD